MTALKRTAAIFFLCIFCLNLLGYRYIFDYLEKKHDQQFEADLDDDQYDESSLISIKAALSIPYSYLSKSGKFERWKGEIEIGGIKYKYVKRRFYSDSIELLCIPNLTATKLKEARQDFFRISNDLPSNTGKKQDAGQRPVFKNLLSEYCEPVSDWNLAIASLKHDYQSSYGWFIPTYTGDSPGQPPDRA